MPLQDKIGVHNEAALHWDYCDRSDVTFTTPQMGKIPI